MNKPTVTIIILKQYYE